VRCEDVGGGDGVLNSEVDADAADGRHGVGSVADGEEAGQVPAGEVVDLHGEQFHLVPAGEGVDAVRQKRDEARDGGAEGVEAVALDLGEAVLLDDEGALEVVIPVDEDGEGAVVDVADDVGGVAGTARKAEPEDVDRDAGLVHGKLGVAAAGGVAAIAGDGKGGANLDGAVGGFRAGADDAALLIRQEADGIVLHEEMEAGELGGLCGEEVEEVPLRHDGDELAMRGDAVELRDGEGLASDDHGEGGYLLMALDEKLVEKAELVHQLEGGGMDGVAAEVAEEVGVFLEDGDVDAGAREEEAEHHAGGASADDAAGSGDLRGLGVGHRGEWSP